MPSRTDELRTILVAKGASEYLQAFDRAGAGLKRFNTYEVLAAQAALTLATTSQAAVRAASVRAAQTYYTARASLVGYQATSKQSLANIAEAVSIGKLNPALAANARAKVANALTTRQSAVATALAHRRELLYASALASTNVAFAATRLQAARGVNALLVAGAAAGAAVSHLNVVNVRAAKTSLAYAVTQRHAARGAVINATANLHAAKASQAAYMATARQSYANISEAVSLGKLSPGLAAYARSKIRIAVLQRYSAIQTAQIALRNAQLSRTLWSVVVAYQSVRTSIALAIRNLRIWNLTTTLALMQNQRFITSLKIFTAAIQLAVWGLYRFIALVYVQFAAVMTFIGSFVMAGAIKKATEFEALMKDTQVRAMASAAEIRRVAASSFGQEFQDIGRNAISAALGYRRLTGEGYSLAESQRMLLPILQAVTLLGGSEDNMTRLMITLMKQFNYEARQMSEIADRLVGALRHTSLQGDEVRDSLRYMGVAASSLNWSLSETLAVADPLVATIGRARVAGRYFREWVNAMRTPTKEMAAGFRQAGLDVNDFYKYGNDAVKMLQWLQSGTWNTKNISQAFGTAVRQDVANILLNVQIPALQYNIDKINETGQAHAASIERMKTVRGALEQLAAAWDNFRIRAGQSITQYTAHYINSVTQILKAFERLILKIVSGLKDSNSAWHGNASTIRFSAIAIVNSLAAIVQGMLSVAYWTALAIMILQGLNFAIKASARTKNLLASAAIFAATAAAVFAGARKMGQGFEAVRKSTAAGFQALITELDEGSERVERSMAARKGPAAVALAEQLSETRKNYERAVAELRKEKEELAKLEKDTIGIGDILMGKGSQEDVEARAEAIRKQQRAVAWAERRVKASLEAMVEAQRKFDQAVAGEGGQAPQKPPGPIAADPNLEMQRQLQAWEDYLKQIDFYYQRQIIYAEDAQHKALLEYALAQKRLHALEEIQRITTRLAREGRPAEIEDEAGGIAPPPVSEEDVAAADDARVQAVLRLHEAYQQVQNERKKAFEEAQKELEAEEEAFFEYQILMAASEQAKTSWTQKYLQRLKQALQLLIEQNGKWQERLKLAQKIKQLEESIYKAGEQERKKTADDMRRIAQQSLRMHRAIQMVIGGRLAPAVSEAIARLTGAEIGQQGLNRGWGIRKQDRRIILELRDPQGSVSGPMMDQIVDFLIPRLAEAVERKVPI
jgi:TP901 family phage tail tape measure protein